MNDRVKDFMSKTCYDASEAVFTISQREEIVKIDMAFNDLLMDEINTIKCQLKNLQPTDLTTIENKISCILSDIKTQDLLEEKVRRLSKEVEALIKYDENNSIVITKLTEEFNRFNKDVKYLDIKIKELSDKTAAALVCQGTELNELSRRVSKLQVQMDELECMIRKDTRASEFLKIVKELATKEEIILKRLAVLEAINYKDNRVDHILDVISTLATQKEIEKLDAKVCVLARREFVDSRVDSLMRKLAVLEDRDIKDKRVEQILRILNTFSTKEDIEEIKKINAAQTVMIKDLHVENTKQQEHIQCLTAKLNRDILMLDGKINAVAANETLDKKVDYEQSSDIKFLQSQIVKLNEEMDRLQKVVLMKPCSR